MVQKQWQVKLLVPLSKSRQWQQNYSSLTVKNKRELHSLQIVLREKVKEIIILSYLDSQ